MAPKTGKNSFEPILRRAESRKGGAEILAGLLPPPSAPAELAAIEDDRILAEMTRRVFCSGFVWSVIEKKWPDFEEAFLGFDPGRLLNQPPEFWDRLLSDRRIVRNGQKIMSVQKNAAFIVEIARDHGSFGRFLADWPASDEIGLLDLLARRGSRLGGHTGQYFLRFIGKDSFILSKDVVLCLKDFGLEIADNPTSRRDLARIGQQFNRWAEETGLSFTQLSRICAMSIGENVPPSSIREYLDQS